MILPAEHGSWSWLLVPFFVGLIVAGEWSLPALLVLVGGLAGFLIRQPASFYARVRSGRARKSDGPLALTWTIFLAVVAFLCLIALLVMGRGQLIWLVIPMIAVFFLYILASRQPRARIRTLWMEIAGAIGLAAMAPSAYIAVTGSLDETAWYLWVLTASINTLGVLYVRIRIADTHGRDRDKGFLLWGHAAVLFLVTLGALNGLVHWGTVVPYLVLLGRASWLAKKPRPVDNIKRFGFIEIGVEIVGGLFIAAGLIL